MGQISDLDTLSTFADGDLVVVRDVSDATNKDKKALWSLFKSTLKTYFDTLYTAINTAVLLTGTQTIAGDKTFSGTIIASDAIYTRSVTLTDGTVTSFTPPKNIGVVIVSGVTGGTNTMAGVVAYDTALGASTLIAGGGNLAVTTGILTGASGTSGKFTISPHTNGLIYVNCRVSYGGTLALLFVSN